ncbi:MAG: hypothetical protein ABI158_06680, partial [Edaphobacter sp.]
MQVANVSLFIANRKIGTGYRKRYSAHSSRFPHPVESGKTLVVLSAADNPCILPWFLLLPVLNGGFCTDSKAGRANRQAKGYSRDISGISPAYPLLGDYLRRGGWKGAGTRKVSRKACTAAILKDVQS